MVDVWQTLPLQDRKRFPRHLQPACASACGVVQPDPLRLGLGVTCTCVVLSRQKGDLLVIRNGSRCEGNVLGDDDGIGHPPAIFAQAGGKGDSAYFRGLALAWILNISPALGCSDAYGWLVTRGRGTYAGTAEATDDRARAGT